MITKINNIPHQYARVGESFSFQIPSNTFTSGGSISYTAKAARKIKGISLNRFWLNFNTNNATFTGSPSTFHDEGALQIEVTATDSSDGSSSKAYFVIITYPEGSTVTTVLPRTSAECDFVLDNDVERDGSGGKILFGDFTPFEGMTIGIKGDITEQVQFRDLPEYVLITNVDGVATIHNGSRTKSLNFYRCNNFKVIGQAVDSDPTYNNPIYGLKVMSGNDGEKVLSDFTPNPSFNFAGNGGGSAIEIEAHCQNGIEVSYVDIPYSGSAGIKIRTKFFKLPFLSGVGNTSGATTLNFTGANTDQIARTGWLEIDGDRYQYSNFSSSTFTLTTPLTRTYAEGLEGSTASGLRLHHDMNKIILRHNLLDKIDTEGIYMGEGFFTGNEFLLGENYGLPADIRRVRIEHNIIMNTGYDPVQDKNSVFDVKIRYNYCFNNSYRNIDSQKFGIFVSDGTNAEISHNWIERVAATGLRIYVGNNFIHNNVVIAAGLDPTTPEQQAVGGYAQGGTSNIPLTEDFNLGGYFIPAGYNSTPELGTTTESIKLRLQNNTFVGYGEDAIELSYTHIFEYGNNLFVDGGTNVSQGVFTVDLGGNIFCNSEEADFINAELKDYRIGINSLGRNTGINLSSIVSKDYNDNTITVGGFAGAFLPDSNINEDNFSYLVGSTAVVNPYTEWRWYQADTEFGTYVIMFGETNSVLTNVINTKWYKRGIIVKDINGNASNEVLSNAVQYLQENIVIEPSNIVLSASTIQENNNINDVIGTLSASGDTPITYSISGTDAASFNINGNQLRASELFDFETKTTYSIIITATNEGGNDTLNVTINITNENEGEEEPSQINIIEIGTVSNGVGNNPNGYVEYLPEEYSTRNDWPIWIHYPGGGETGNGSTASLTTQILGKQIMQRLNAGLNLPFIIIAPQSTSAEFGGTQFENNMNWNLTKYSGKYDPKQVHISVISGTGASGLTNWLNNNPASAQAVNTIGYFSSNGLPQDAPDNDIYININANNIRTWFHHGAVDSAVSLASRRTYFGRIHAVFGRTDTDIHRFTGYPNRGHDTWNIIYAGEGKAITQLTGAIDSGIAHIGNYYPWVEPETYYTWMLEEVLAKGSFAVSPTSPTVDEEFTISADAWYYESFEWDFGDGNTNSVDINPNHTYTTIGTKTITLTLINRFGSETIITTDVEVEDIPAPTIIQTILLDHNETGSTAGSTYNNLQGFPHTGAPNKTNLTNTEGDSTGISITFNEDWVALGGASTAGQLGAQTGNNSGAFSDAALRGYHFSQVAGGTSSFTLGNLDPTKKYDFKIIGSRETTSGNRVTSYTIGGVTKTLAILGNTANTVEFLNVEPDGSNEITVTISETGDNDFAYINVTKIDEHN